MTMTFHAASREALVAAELRLIEVIDGAKADALSTLGTDLFGVLDLLSRESTLRRTLADASSEPAARARLLRGLLEGKVSASALDVLDSVVTARWSNPREFCDGIESLSRTALLARAERDGRLDSVEDELFRLGRIVAGQPDLELVLSNPTGDRAGKLALIDGLLAGKVEPVTATLVEQLVGLPRGRRIVEGLEELAGLAAKRRERSIAYVQSAVALTDAQEDRLSATLTRIYARPIALHVEVKPSLGGGLVIRIGDEVVDGSVAGRLDAVRRELAG
ncbi:F0F1 ATP synthase subunit delta [Solihabitans fulvus]|uniref:ATP synthase subunit delta n=1 Tax=Solihabitans fulvus TaxID=1892852 RepID=A0A5B2X852_9PSEU|nr:F0F1 ATP synthase subunit delta [Solihabitans fulvus]KAA2259430.1 F0F1 ATP synthase subunit delta [Solihabitans fulvus]